MHSCKLALSAAISVGILYTVKTLLWVWSPDFLLQIKSAIRHVPVEVLQHHHEMHQVTAASYITGLVAFGAFAFLLVWLTGVVHCYVSGEHHKHK